jgi:putative heme-binding domain-containing protein
MKQISKMGFAFRLGSTVCLASTFVSSAQNLPAGTGSAEFQRICSSCHATNIVTNQRMTRAEWAGLVSDMVSRGAQGSPEDLDKVVGYLAANFGKSGPSPSAPAETSPPAPVAKEKETPLSEAELSRAKELVQANKCLSCHRIGDAGSYLAPKLTDIGANRSAQQLRDSLVSPDKEVFYENRLVRIVTQDGKTLTGRLLNHDSYSVQFIESSGQLESVKKAGLREFTIIAQNPMPSYGDKMSADDLTILIHYLSSLKGGDAL